MAIRILGEVTEAQLKIARHADQIWIEEIISGGFYREISQAFAALLPVRAVGVAGDRRVYSQIVGCFWTEFVTLTEAYLFTDLLESSPDYGLYDRSVSTVGHSEIMHIADIASKADFWYPPRNFIQKVSLRITNEVDGVSRVEYDLTSKPPGKPI